MTDLFFRFSELTISILMLFTTVIIWILAIKISRGQLNVQKLQLKHDLYERRYKIYTELIRQYGDFDERLNLTTLKDRNFGIKHWLNDYEYHIYFLFEESILNKAKRLYEELKLANSEYQKDFPEKEMVKKIDSLYMDLKKEISSFLSFSNLM